MISDDYINRAGKKLFVHKLSIPSQNLYQVMDLGVLSRFVTRDAGYELPAIDRDVLSFDSQYKSRDAQIHRDGIESLCAKSFFLYCKLKRRLLDHYDRIRWLFFRQNRFYVRGNMCSGPDSDLF